MTPEQVASQIRQYAAEAGASDLTPLLIAIAKQESGLDPTAKGDNGHSWGLYQENDNGRGHGIAIASRQDIRASTLRAIAELRVTQRAHPDADPGQIAILAQRPAENVRTSYRANINASLRSNQPSATAQRAAAGAQAGAQRALAAFNGTYVMPVDGVVTNPFGGKQVYSAGKTTNIGSINQGVDLATKAGTDVRAPVGGKIISVYETANDDRKGERDAEENSGWGGSIVIKGDDGQTHRLSHAQFGSILVKKGQRVEEGQITHKVGMSGNATGSHVDWEVVDAKGNHVDALKAPAMPASGAAKYLASLGIPDRADQGAGNVSQSAANPNAGVVSTFEAREKELRKQIDENQTLLNDYTEIEASLKNNAKRTNGTPDEQARYGETYNRAVARVRSLQEAIARDKDDLQDTIKLLGAARQTASGKALDPDQRDALLAQTENTRAQTARLQQQLDNGGLTPIQEADIRSQIAARNASVRQADALLQGQIAGQAATTARTAQETAEAQATLPYRIDQTISATNLNDAQAQRIREMLGPELERNRVEIDRINQLTPVEVEQGRANVDLTRQRAEETRRMLQPTIDRIASQNQVDAANVARIVQTLPLELAQQAADTQLTQANVGLTNARTAQTGAETQLTQLQGAAEAERQRRWAAVEQQIRDNPAMSADQVNSLVLGAASGLQDWATAYRTQLDTQVARQNAAFQTQQNQLSQQNADVAQFSAAQQADIGQQNARTNQVNALENTAAPSGPTRRMARMQAAGSLGGIAGIEEQARGGRVGASEMNAAKAGFEQFQSMLQGIRNNAGTIRRAPDITAPPPINIGFTPPTMGISPPAPPPGPGPGPGPVPVPIAPIPASNPFAFTAPVITPEQIQRNRVSSGRGGV